MMAMPPVGIMGALQNALASPGMMQGVQPQAAPAGGFQPKRMPGGFLNVLGQIGDVLAVMGGRDPMYAPWRQQREAQNAFGQWANNPDDPATRANFLGMGGANAWKVMQDRMGEQMEARKLALQERKLTADAEQDSMTPFMRDVVAAGAKLGSPEHRRLLEARYNQMRLYGSPEGGYTPDPNWRPAFEDTPEGPAPQARRPPGTAIDYLRRNPGTRAQFDSMYGPGAAARALGGASPSGSRPFP